MSLMPESVIKAKPMMPDMRVESVDVTETGSTCTGSTGVMRMVSMSRVGVNGRGVNGANGNIIVDGIGGSRVGRYVVDGDGIWVSGCGVSACCAER